MDKIPVLFAGTGKMTKAAALVMADDPQFEILDIALSRSHAPKAFVDFGKGVFLNKYLISEAPTLFAQLRESHPNFIVVDYTSDATVADQVKLYTDHSVPFVFGTTGGDRKALDEMVQSSQTVGLLDVNMAMAVILLRDAVTQYASKGKIFDSSNSHLHIRESHHWYDALRGVKGKEGVSGTANVFRELFEQMGLKCPKEKIASVREQDDQLKLGIPKEYLSAHGFHLYSITTVGHTQVLQDLFNHLAQYLVDSPAICRELPVFYRGTGNGIADKDSSVVSQLSRISRSSSLSDVCISMRLDVHQQLGAKLILEHNILGRAVYGRGTADGVKFVHSKALEKEKGKAYHMIDLSK